MTPKQIGKLLDRYRVDDGERFRLKDHDPAESGGQEIDRAIGETLLASGITRLIALQEKLYAQDEWAVLCVFQAMDAAGKDGTVAHVMSGVNPAGVQVSAFKAPGPEELEHGFLWRITRELPRRGRIGIFNRSHYEEVLVTRVHPELIERQRVPHELRGKKFWRHRLDDIANFETYLARQGTVILKFFLNISKDEQKRRFLARLDDPAKNWKFSASDLAERGHWDEYVVAYQDAIAATATTTAPWYVVPSNHKWFCHFIVAEAIVAALDRLDLKTPEPTPEVRAALAEARAALQSEGD